MFRNDGMKRITAAAFLAALSVATLAAQGSRAPNSVTAIRHWSVGHITRVAVEVSGEFEFRTDRLHNPERIYYDIPNARPWIESRRIYSMPVDDKLISRIRVAETLPGVTRVVLDLTGPAEPTASQLSNPNRLIIELSAAAPETTPPVITALPRKLDLPIAAPKAELPAPVAARIAPPPPVTAPPASIVSSPPRVALPSTPAARAALRTSAGQTSLVRALGLKVSRVVIDAGHGGHDHGTEGPKGLLEKELVLDVAFRIGKLIEDRLGAEVIYIRTDDNFVPLEGRTALANEKKADLFLSIHANSSALPRIGGVETYYLNFTNSKESLDVASRENASSQKSIYELQDIIQKITAHEKSEESKEFAERVQASLHTFSARNLPGVKNRGIKKAPFVVLVGANMPSILAEIGFLSNPREEALLKKPEYRQKLADALFRGLQRYAESLSHFQVAQVKE